MLLDLRTATENPALEADICVIGAGIAGLTIARCFLRHAARVVVLESGGLRYDEQAQEFNDGASTGMRYYDLRDSRVRFVGGTINIWGGRCAPLDAIDFETRPWVPHSGWPIGLSDLEPWYRRRRNVMICATPPTSHCCSTRRLPACRPLQVAMH